jgi:hypothetical protein
MKKLVPYLFLNISIYRFSRNFITAAFDLHPIGPWHYSALPHLDIPCHCAYVHPRNGSRPPFPALTVNLCNFSHPAF